MIGIILGIVLIAPALAITAGSCDSFTFETSVINYTVAGNSTDTTGMTVQFVNASAQQPMNISICFDFAYESDNITLTFYSDLIPQTVAYKQAETEKIVYRGGGGGCIASWICDAWGPCVENGTQSRTCNKFSPWPSLTKYCWAPKVNLTQSCVYVSPEQDITSNITNNTNNTNIDSITAAIPLWLWFVLGFLTFVMLYILWRAIKPTKSPYEVSDSYNDYSAQE